MLLLNRDLDGEREVVLEWGDVVPTRVLACETLTGPDLKAFNTFEEPRRVAPQTLAAPAAGARMTFRLPPRSYTVLHLGLVSGPQSKNGSVDSRRPSRNASATSRNGATSTSLSPLRISA